VFDDAVKDLEQAKQMTEALVREFQRTHGLVPDGIVGPKTWEALA